MFTCLAYLLACGAQIFDLLTCLRTLCPRFCYLLCISKVKLQRFVCRKYFCIVILDIFFLFKFILFNGHLNRGCLVYMFSLRFQEVNIWYTYGGNFVYVTFSHDGNFVHKFLRKFQNPTEHIWWNVFWI